ncbi:hypothetical protein XENTR_v10006882 [Xenopus tropicalis]|nr:hypothetical protein XENTR_v10006882 [Xenopus tropicalis]
MSPLKSCSASVYSMVFQINICMHLISIIYSIFTSNKKHSPKNFCKNCPFVFLVVVHLHMPHTPPGFLY